jgi:acylphosphatase
MTDREDAAMTSSSDVMDAAAADDRDGSTENSIRIEAVVRGHVQGVGFRYFVRRRASALGLVGSVANEADGTVRCVAEGPEAEVEELLAALHAGPPGARVDGVEVARSRPSGGFDRFAVRSGGHSGD